MDDFERLNISANIVKSCILPRSANKNILLSQDTSHCGREAWEKTSKCHRIVTVDFATQSARFCVPLQNSAVGFSSPVFTGAQSPKSYFGGFFCARLVWQLQMAGRMGAPSGAPVSCDRSTNPVRSVSSFSSEDGGKQSSIGVQPC